MSDTATKARTLRLDRLRSMLENHISHVPAAVEALMSELRMGETQPHLWEALHLAAARDGKQAELADIYRKLRTDRRIKQLPLPVQADVFMHAADFLQGVIGDGDGATAFLLSVLDVAPDRREAFTRLERRFEGTGDRVRLIELYAKVAGSPPRPAHELARWVLNEVALLSARTPISDEACKQLLLFVPSSSAVLSVLEEHCRKTGRTALACTLLEQAIEGHGLTEARVVDQRRRLIELYLGDAAAPEKAISHVEALLGRDPADAKARAAAERLLTRRDVASRAAAALQQARRQSLIPTGSSS
jgi:hypothetical protein